MTVLSDPKAAATWKRVSSSLERESPRESPWTLMFIELVPLGVLYKGGLRRGPRGAPPPFCGLSNTVFQHYMFNMESRYFLDLSVQKALDFISKNFNLKNCFQGGACTRTSLEKCAARSSDRRYRAHNAIVCYISRPPLSQNPPSALVIIPCSD